MIHTFSFFLIFLFFICSGFILYLVLSRCSLNFWKGTLLIFGILVLFLLRLSSRTDTPVVYHDEDWYLEQSRHFLVMGENCRCTYYEDSTCYQCDQQIDHYGLVAMNAFFFRLFGMSEAMLQYVYLVLSCITLLFYYGFIQMLSLFYLPLSYPKKNVSYFMAVAITLLWGGLYIFRDYATSLVPLIPFLFTFSVLCASYTFFIWLQRRQAHVGYQLLIFLFFVVTYLFTISLRFEGVFLIFFFLLLYCCELYSTKRITKRTTVILMGFIFLCIISSLFMINPIVQWIVQSSDSTGLNTNYFGGKEFGTLLSFRLLQTNVLTNLSLFTDFLFLNPIHSILVTLGFGIMILGFFLKPQARESVILSFLLFSAFLLFFVFYQLYYEYPLNEFYNDRRFILFLYFLIPSSVFSFYSVLDNKKRFIFSLSLVTLFAIGASSFYQIDYPENLMEERQESLELAKLAKMRNGLVTTYEPSYFIFLDVSSISLPSFTTERRHIIIEDYLQKRIPVYYYDMYASRFYYGYPKIKAEIEKQYVLLPDSFRILYNQNKIANSSSGVAR